jgi:predicted nucleic acid-binding protein
MTVFIDTGAFLARYLSNDVYHAQAVAVWKRLRGKTLFTSNHVIDETLTLLARRAGGRFAADRAENIYASQALEIIYTTPDDELQAVQLLRKYSDQNVSFTDCISFALMKTRRIALAFSFDHHFHRAGFRTIGTNESHP